MRQDATRHATPRADLTRIGDSMFATEGLDPNLVTRARAELNAFQAEHLEQNVKPPLSQS